MSSNGPTMRDGVLAITSMISDIGGAAKGASPFVQHLTERINVLIGLAGQRPAQQQAIRAAKTALKPTGTA